MVEWEKAMIEGRPRDLVDWAPPELPSVRTKVFNMIENLKTPWNKIVLGGFSQGAMLATDIYLSAPEKPQGLILFSGALINKPEWKEKISNRSGGTFFQSHGQSDAILSHKGAQQLEGFLNQFGVKGRLHSFSGGHEIPMEVIAKANEYLKSID
jgi:phospholipase/carboxylesterase